MEVSFDLKLSNPFQSNNLVPAIFISISLYVVNAIQIIKIVGTIVNTNAANKVGVIDSDYRGEIKVGVINQIDKEYTIEPNERIAQMVIMPVSLPEIIEVNELDETQRGTGGFGSTNRF